jgi:hypothetical protein
LYCKIEHYSVVAAYEFEIDLIVAMIRMVEQSISVYLFELLVLMSLFVVNRVGLAVVVVVVVAVENSL